MSPTIAFSLFDSKVPSHTQTGAHVMEDSKELIGELLAKLAEMNNKVDNFRQDMLFEFNKFTEDLLRGVPDSVSYEVSRVIAESMSKYPLLSIPSRREPDSPVTPTTTEAMTPHERRKSPPPILYHTSGIPRMFKEGARDPHDREFEFQGLFTPSYLPLLDGNDPPAKQQRVDPSWAFRRSAPLVPGGGPYPGGEPPYDSPPVVHAQPAADRNNDNDNDDQPVVEMIEEVEVPDTCREKNKESVRPSPDRELTDVSISSSVASSTSEHKIRRSALRRSSSSTKGSPRSRRVRFDVEGTEVLPTASPQPSESFLGSVGGLHLDAPASSAMDDSEDYNGPSLSEVEGEEDHRPRPARISSTDALRRLSRTPSDDGTVWISSNEAPPAPAGADGSSETGASATSSLSKTTASADPTPTQSPITSHMSVLSGQEDKARRAARPNGNRPTHAVGSPSEADAEQDDEDDNEEDVFLAIRSPKKAPWHPATLPTVVSPTVKPPTARVPSSERRAESPKTVPTANHEGEGRKKDPAQHADEEEVFDFEDAIRGSSPAEKYLPEQEEGDAVAEDATGDEEATPPVPQNLYSVSPAVPIPKRKTPSPPTHSRPVQESIGSYKGQPLRMSAVTSPKIVEEAAAMGDVKTYVGSVYGRTGIDPADESSYRASFSNAKLFSGTPRSFSERLMMEEAMGKTDDDEVD